TLILLRPYLGVLQTKENGPPHPTLSPSTLALIVDWAAAPPVPSPPPSPLSPLSLYPPIPLPTHSGPFYRRIMPVTIKGMTIDAIEELIGQRMADALATYETNQNTVNGNGNGNGSGSQSDGGGGSRRTIHTARGFTYKELLNCQPLNFKGTEGADLMKMMTEAYCPRNKIQKLESELWNLTVKGTDDFRTVDVPATPTTPASTRPRTYDDLTYKEKIHEACDIRATNIVLQGLPPVRNTKVSVASIDDSPILSGADNRSPMLEKDMYDSWKSIMELYMMNRQHGRMILESVENGPLIWPSIEENGVTRPKKYFELSAREAIQVDCDIKETNIILQGLPPEVYALVRNHKFAKELWGRIQLLMQGT
ncbi:hypothetical protein Tco_0422202, partial [Tanacetum coccineum]